MVCWWSNAPVVLWYGGAFGINAVTKFDADVTVSMPRSLEEEIEAELEYGDSKSAWIREAVQERLNGREQVTSDN